MEDCRNTIVRESDDILVIKKKGGFIGAIGVSLFLMVLMAGGFIFIFSAVSSPMSDTVLYTMLGGFFLLFLLAAWISVGMFAYYQNIVDLNSRYLGRKPIGGRHKLYKELGRISSFGHEVIHLGGKKEHAIFATCELGKKLFTDEKSEESAAITVETLNEYLSIAKS